MSETIKLKFRQGGDEWTLEPGAYFIREYGTIHYEYAGPYQLEIEEPEPEPLRIEGYERPRIRLQPICDDGEIYLVTAGKVGCSSICVHGSTRREAIENFNHLARKMGAQSQSLTDHLDLMNAMERHGIPQRLRHGLCGYALEHRRTGDFLLAVLSNDFTQAVLRADDESFAALREIARFIHGELPDACHGSEEAVRKWLENQHDQN